MERSTLGRNSLVVVVLAATIALTGESSFGETTECKASPGAAAPQGMHWYYRVDRTNNRHCWYLQSAGMEVRSHLSMTGSSASRKTRSGASQIVAESGPAPRQSDAEEATSSPVADTMPAETPRLEPTIADRAATDFTGRWLDLPEAVDLQAGEIDQHNSYAAEQTAPVTKEPIASPIWFVAADAKDVAPQRSAGLANFGSVFLVSALGIMLFDRVLKLTRRWYDFGVWPMLARSDQADGPEKDPVELKHILRRVDNALQSPRSFAPSGRQVTEMLSDRRASKPDYRGDRPHSAVRRLSRDPVTV